MTEVSFRALKHFFFGRVEKLSVSPAHFSPVSVQLFRFYSADSLSNSSIISFIIQSFIERSIPRLFHLGLLLFFFHLLSFFSSSHFSALLYLPASFPSFFFFLSNLPYF